MSNGFLCGPSIIYIGFSFIQIVIDLFKKNYSNAFMKFIIMIILALVINILCNMGLTIIAWFLVFIPIIMMTIISTLLLKTFGTNPNSDELQKNVNTLKDNYDSSGNYYDYNNLLSNKQKLLQQQNLHSDVERLDRNKFRKDLYDKLEIHYNLQNDEKDRYDLSRNPLKYRLADNYVNDPRNNYYFKNYANNLNMRALFNYVHGLNGQLQNFFNLKKSYSTTSNTSSNNNSNSGENKSYADYYGDNLQDGFYAFKTAKGDSIKNELLKTKPNATPEEIDKEIEAQWNQLTLSKQEEYNSGAQSNNMTNYNPYDFESYRNPVSNNSISYLDSSPSTTSQSAECPPGQIKNSEDTCYTPSQYLSNL